MAKCSCEDDAKQVSNLVNKMAKCVAAGHPAKAAAAGAPAPHSGEASGADFFKTSAASPEEKRAAGGLFEGLTK